LPLLFYKTEEIVMALSQPATFNEEWSDERVFAYLNQLPPTGVNADFHVLYHAFKHMRPNDYERLITQFLADGRDLNATNPEGQRIHDVIALYPRQKDGFLEVLAKFA
jgi:hypothetical protein